MNAANQGDVLVALIFHTSAIPAALMGQAPPSQVPSNTATTTDVPSVPQAMNAGAGPILLQNLPSETKAYLQQRQAAALAAYSQQQLAQQQAQSTGLISNPGSSSVGQAPGTSFNVAQLFQGMQGMPQQADGGNQIGLGGPNLSHTPALQQVQHRQPASGLNPAQTSSIQMFPLNRRPDDGQGQ